MNTDSLIPNSTMDRVAVFVSSHLNEYLHSAPTGQYAPDDLTLLRKTIVAANWIEVLHGENPDLFANNNKIQTLFNEIFSITNDKWTAKDLTNVSILHVLDVHTRLREIMLEVYKVLSVKPRWYNKAA